MLRQLSPSDLAGERAEEWLPAGILAEVEPATRIVGQDRATTVSRHPNADLSENPILLCYKYLNFSHAVMT